LIIYRKAPPLRIRRSQVPEPPFWAATSIAPYGTRRAAPLAIDYLELRASSSERLEVSVCEDVRDELERSVQRQPLADPTLIEATEVAEIVFRRGEEVLRFCCESGCAPMQLVSTRGALPMAACNRTTITIATWPLDLARLEQLFQDAGERKLRWGPAIPVIFPVTNNLQALADLATLAQRHGASFLAAIPVDLDATARNALAQSLAMPAERETYDMLFHADLEPIHVATERHIAALAAEIGVADFVVPPRWEEKSNWNAAVLLTLAATRMIAMKRDVESASRLARSARAVAQLDKPLERIAAAANLSIIESLDDISVDVLTDWLDSGRSAFVDHVNKQWRLRRDAGLAP
jgi:hypothetical protein